MSRDDPIAEHRVSLGACDCPPNEAPPHTEGDFAMVRDSHNYASVAVLTSAAQDEAAFLLKLTRDGIRSWNLVGQGDQEGVFVPLPITDANVDRLSASQKIALLSDIRAVDVVLALQLPNPPAARSGNGRAVGSASRNSRRKNATR